MDTSQLFIICIDCQALYFYVLKGHDAFFKVPGKRKLYPWHSSTKCPACERRGFLHETSFKKYYDMYEDAKKECYRARADKETALTALYQAREQVKALQAQLDALGPIGSEQAAGNLCQCGCGKVVGQPTTGRARKFYNAACRQRYFRQQHKQQQPRDIFKILDEMKRNERVTKG